MKLRLLLLGLSVGVLLVGCGSSGSAAVSNGKADPPAGNPSREFEDPTGSEGKEAVATFGKESSDEDRDQASAVLAESLKSRQEGDFAAQCATLGKRGIEAVVGEGKSAEASECPKELEELAKPLSQSKEIRADTLRGQIAALRVRGNLGYALYHGNDGNDYAMPMEKEVGGWKVGGIVTTELPRPQPKSESLPKKKGSSGEP